MSKSKKTAEKTKVQEPASTPSAAAGGTSDVAVPGLTERKSGFFSRTFNKLFGSKKKKTEVKADPRVSANIEVTPGTLWWEEVPAGDEVEAKTKGETVLVDGQLLRPFRTVGEFTLEPSAVTYHGEWFSTQEDEKRFYAPVDSLHHAQHVAETDELFTDQEGKDRPPRPEDVIQGELGDCYLEAALSALAAQRPDDIKKMMTDNKDGTVSVTLHDVTQKKKGPVFKARVIRINKSRVRRNGKLVLDAGALWVGLVEKAYAAGRFGGTAQNTAKARESKDTDFESIVGGHSYYATEVLTGRPAQRFNIGIGGAQNAKAGAGLPWGAREAVIHTQQKQAKEPNYTGMASYAALHQPGAEPTDTATLVDQWMTWLAGGGSAAIATMFDQRRTPQGEYKHGAVRLSHFEEMFAGDLKLDPAVMTPMLSYLEAYYPGKRGSGKYTGSQKKVWTLVTEALERRALVMASSHESISSKGSDGEGHSGGEGMKRGLVGGHAYTVLDVKQEGEVKFVKMRNPWGKYGREYEKVGSSLKPKEAGKGSEPGVSWFELNDVTKRFRSFDIQ